jgi:hypothetical protein
MIYYGAFTGISATAAQDFFELLVPSDAVARILEITLTQSTEAGDAQSEQLSVSVIRVTGAPTSGSGGGSITPVPRESGQAASGATLERNNTTTLTGGTQTVIHSESFNVMAGLSKTWTPETAPLVSPGNYLVVRANGAPTDSITFDGTIIWDEMGG